MHLQNHFSSQWCPFPWGWRMDPPPVTSFLISYFVTYFAWHPQLYPDDSAPITRITWIVKTKCRNTWEWNGSYWCLVPLTLCACQSKSTAVFCWFLSAVDISVLKAFGSHTYKCNFSRKSWHPLKIFPLSGKLCLASSFLVLLESLFRLNMLWLQWLQELHQLGLKVCPENILLMGLGFWLFFESTKPVWNMYRVLCIGSFFVFLLHVLLLFQWIFTCFNRFNVPWVSFFGWFWRHSDGRCLVWGGVLSVPVLIYRNNTQKKLLRLFIYWCYTESLEWDYGSYMVI